MTYRNLTRQVEEAMALRDWSTGRVIGGWVVVVVIVPALWLVTGTKALKSALLFSYILQLLWIAVVLPAVAVTYAWAHVRFTEPTRSRLKTALLVVAVAVIFIWLGLSCPRFR